MIVSAAIILAAMQAQSGRDLSRLEPIYAEPSSFISKEGERMRLGSYMPPADRLEELNQMGIKLFVSETDRLAPPDQGTGPYSIENLAAQRNAALATGAKWGLDVYTSFTNFDDMTSVGEGTLEMRTGEKVPAWSPWNPQRISFTAVRYGRMNRAFAEMGMVSLGVFGEFGDASMFSGLVAFAPELASRWEDTLRTEPPSAGFWSGDTFARDSWKRALEAKFGSIEQAYAAWGMSPANAAALPIPLDASYPYIARIDFQDWYRSALPQMSAALADIGRNIFKKSPVVVPIGPPNDLPELGLDIFRVAEAVKPNATALKVTNLGLYDFAENWAMSLARIRSSARAAGIPLIASSPYGSPSEFSERLFEAVALGATAVIDAPNAFLGNRRNLSTLSPGLVHQAPRTDVAVLHPTNSHLLSPGRVAPAATYRGATELRDYADFDVLTESAVAAGALKPYRVAIVFEGPVWDGETLQAIKEWVSGGGTIVAYDFGKMADLRGNTSVYQELFGFASSLPPAPDSLRWQGEIPATYTLDVGSQADEMHLAAGWADSDGVSRRAMPGATILLPVGEGTSVVTVSLAKAPASGRVEFRSRGRFLAGVGSNAGVRQVQFAVDSSLVHGNVLSITATGFEAADEVRIDTIEVATESGGTAMPLAGRFVAPVAVETVKAWTHPFGKGCAIFAPIKQTEREQFLSVVRHAIFSLSEIASGKSDAKNFDDRRDGLYVVDLGERIAIFNATDKAADWTMPNGSGAVTVPAASFRFFSGSATPPPIVVQAETFATPTAPLAESRAASPGQGATAVRVAANAVFEIVLNVPEARTYRVYARTLRNGNQVPVRFRVGDVESAPVAAAGPGDVYLVGEFSLNAGENRIQLLSDKTFLADVVVATAEHGIIGFRFPPKL